MKRNICRQVAALVSITLIALWLAPGGVAGAQDVPRTITLSHGDRISIYPDAGCALYWFRLRISDGTTGLGVYCADSAPVSQVFLPLIAR